MSASLIRWVTAQEGFWGQRVGSMFKLNWFPSDAWASIVDCERCCCCAQVAAVQIYTDYSSYGILDWLIRHENELDGGFPYPNGDRPETRPCIVPRQFLSIDDAPSGLKYHPIWQRALEKLDQQFETCIICLSGCPEAPICYPEGITVYGCIRWGHRIRQGRRQGGETRLTIGRVEYEHELVIRWIQHGNCGSGGSTLVTEDENGDVYVRQVCGMPPSQEFQATVLDALLADCGALDV